VQRAIEERGIPTVSLSVLRGPTEQLRLSRVLLTRFPRGSTVGPSGDDEVQKRVLRTALQLLVTAKAPVLEEFAE